MAPHETTLRVRLYRVSFAYAPTSPILTGINLEIGPGLTLLLGPNGHGKSTLLKLLAGVEYPDAGRIEVGKYDLWQDEAAARRLLAYVPEQPDITPYATVHEVLELAAWLRGEPLTAVATVLAKVGLDHDTAGRSIRELSKGQRRRALLAAALLGNPPILLLDEPLDALDRTLRDELTTLLIERAAAGAIVVVVTHEIEPFAAAATAAITLHHGALAAVAAQLPAEPAARLALLESMARGKPG